MFNEPAHNEELIQLMRKRISHLEHTLIMVEKAFALRLNVKGRAYLREQILKALDGNAHIVRQLSQGVDGV